MTRRKKKQAFINDQIERVMQRESAKRQKALNALAETDLFFESIGASHSSPKSGALRRALTSVILAALILGSAWLFVIR